MITIRRFGYYVATVKGPEELRTWILRNVPPLDNSKMLSDPDLLSSRKLLNIAKQLNYTFSQND